MGMFDKDKQFAPDGQLHSLFDIGVKCILWDAEIHTEEFIIKDTDGDKPIPMAWVTVSTLDDPNEKLVVSTIGTADIGKIRENDGSDLPAVIEMIQVPSANKSMQDAITFRFVENYKGEVA